jgi:hypothetical protein
LFGFNLGEFQLNIFPTGDNRFTPLTMGPRLYLIYCKPKALFYIGQSSNTISRLGRHYDNLCCGKSDSKAMQTDWDTYSLKLTENFTPVLRMLSVRLKFHVVLS